MIRSQKTIKKDNTIRFIFKTKNGSFLLKTHIFEDLTVQSRFYKVSFDEIGDMLCDYPYGIIHEEEVKQKSQLLNVHDKAFFILKERYNELVNEEINN